MKTQNKSILSTIVLTGVIALCSLTVNAGTIKLSTPQATVAQSDTAKMAKQKMKMEKKKMAMMKKDKMKMDKKKMKMDKMADTTSKM